MYRRIVLAVLLLSLHAASLRATVLVPKTSEDLAHEADAVVVARVAGLTLAVEGYTSTGSTFVVLDVLESLKGDLSGPVTLRIVGGQTGEDPKTARIDGVPRFRIGQDALFYLGARPEEDGRFYNVKGMGQGKKDLADPETLMDGRRLGTLREEVRYAVEHPRSRKTRTPVPGARGKDGSSRSFSVRSVPAGKRSFRAKPPSAGVGTRPVGTPFPLTEAERDKKREIRGEPVR